MVGSRAEEPKSTAPAAASPAKADEGLTGSGGEGDSGKVSDAEAPPTLNQIRYPCLMNMDYHAAREGWLDRVHRWLMFAVIVAGASALVEALPLMKVLGPIIAAVAAALDLTFDLSNRARAHAMFRRRYADILSEAGQDACVAMPVGRDQWRRGTPFHRAARPKRYDRAATDLRRG